MSVGRTIAGNGSGLAADFEFKKPKYMTRVEFTNWLHSELDAVFNGDITPEQVMINAIPTIDLFVSINCGKPHVSGSLPPDYTIAFVEWIAKNDEWIWNNEAGIWKRDGWRSRTTLELYELFRRQ